LQRKASNQMRCIATAFSQWLPRCVTHRCLGNNVASNIPAFRRHVTICYTLISLNFLCKFVYFSVINTELWHVCSIVMIPRDASGRTVNSRFRVKYQLVILGVHDLKLPRLLADTRLLSGNFSLTSVLLLSLLVCWKSTSMPACEHEEVAASSYHS
jgi:hypothetical protein